MERKEGMELKIIEYKSEKYISLNQVDDILLLDSLNIVKQKPQDATEEVVSLTMTTYIRDLRNRLKEATKIDKKW